MRCILRAQKMYNAFVPSLAQLESLQYSLKIPKPPI